MPALWTKASRPKAATEYPRRKIMLWVAIVGILFGLLDFGAPLEDALRIGRNNLRSQNGSGDIVLVAIDNRSVEELGEWPWPRSRYAQLVDQLRSSGAVKIGLDLDLPGRSNLAEDRLLSEALAHTPNAIILSTRFVQDPGTKSRTQVLPLAAFQEHTTLASTNSQYNFRNEVWRLPYSIEIEGRSYPTFAAALAGSSIRKGEFLIDYSVKLDSIPVVSAVDVLKRRLSRETFAGKTIVIGPTLSGVGISMYIPGSEKVSGSYLHVLGAETLKKGRPVDLGWFVVFTVTFGLIFIYIYRERRLLARLALCGAFVITLVAPLFAESRLISFSVMPALIAVLVAVAMRGWWKVQQSYRARSLINAVSGLPNLAALREEAMDGGMPLVAARIHNFAEITSALPHEGERSLVEQIAARLAIGSGGAQIHQGDEGIFVWLAPEVVLPTLGDQLEALHALCRTPIIVGGTAVDLAVTFGVETGSGRSISSRIGSALVAADEALASGRRWQPFDTAKLKDAAWKLSLLGQLEAAIDAGEIWVAYQPKIDLVTKRIIGAEALARWTHPEKGEVSPVEFIPAAEQHNRIEKLTMHVLQDAIRTAAHINSQDIEFEVAVNLSARLLDSTDLAKKITTLLAECRLDARRLTLEVTESVAITGGDRSIEVLGQLRALGVNISIDDYGTGFSTLEALKKIPATEIKIDKGFVRMIDRSQSDRLMVNSTIQLAHSLGRTVVAEGVESADILHALEAMGCDKAQGFLIGRPAAKNALFNLLTPIRKRTAA